MSAERHARLSALFGQAIELAATERAALIERTRGEDAALGDELAALLAADAKLADRPDALAQTVPGRKKPPTLQPAVRIPGYRITGVLGEGGMGTVYVAEQDEPRRKVAIKVLYARSGSAVARFKAEAQIMARLDHPGIARVLEAGDADGKPYLVMEHVDGVTLDVHAAKLDRSQRFALFTAMCDAVHHAHVKGVIHRDLKPANVMVRGDGRVVILDFGVARLAAADGSTPGDTRAGELIGTPLYMSPEQAHMRAADVDARSDVYTLGVILYELACGELPYDIRELPLPAVTTVITEDAPVPLGRRDRTLAGDLEAITSKALAKDPEDRYQSVAAFADDLRRFLAGMPVSVRTPGALERARRYVRRKPLAAAAIAGSALAAAAFAVVVTALWLDARAARHTAEEARAALEGRSNQLVLGTARSALARDPTEAVAWLATMTARDVDAGAAWDILDEATARGVAHDVLARHHDEVHWIEPLPGGDGFVTGGYDGLAIAWEPPAFEPRTLLVAQHGRVHAVRPSPDGQRLAVGCDAGEAHVIARDGRVLATLTGHAGDVQHLAWAKDGAWLATADDHGNTWVWPHGAAPGQRLTVGGKAIGALAFSDDGRALVEGDRDGHVWLWNVETWTARMVDAGDDIVTAWTDGTSVAVVTGGGAVKRWRNGDDALEPAGAVETKQAIKRALFAPGGAWALLGGVGGVVTRVEGDTIETLPAPHAAQVRSVAISRDGRWLADGGDDGTLTLRDRATGRIFPLHGHRGRIRHVELAGAFLLSSDSDGVVRRWHLPDGPPALLTASAPADSLASDGTHVAAVADGGDVWLWSLADGRAARVGRAEGRVTHTVIANGTVVTGTAEGAVTWWADPPVRQQLRGSVKSIAWAGDRVAIATSGGPIAIFAATGAPVATVDGNTGGTEACAFSPHGELLASGGQDRELRVWRREGDAYAVVATLPGLQADVHYVAFTAAGDQLIAAGNDGTVYAWRVTGTQVGERRVVAQHTGAVTAFALDPSGTWIATAGRDSTVMRARTSGGPAISSVLPSAAIALAIGQDGEVHAVTRGGAVVRTSGAGSVTELDHGARTALQLSRDRWLVAHDDGTLVAHALHAPPLANLASALAAATTYRLAR